ncbi:MAG: NAD(P)/FAD-dependent oxidoreductase [Anaerolineales bacterium]|nr:NAD(P)/FAD-dependent oxidoreductase [Anaerolineales bacterium]
MVLSTKHEPQQVAIIGGGLAGLAAAYDLTTPGDHRFQVTILESGPQLGGLASGFKGRESWQWPLEYFYHHLFTNDDAILNFTREVGLGDLLETHDPTTVMFIQGRNYPLDTPGRLLAFPHLSIWNRLRTGAVLGYLKYHPRPPWRDFDRLVADQWLAAKMGRAGYETLWQPMLQGKFDRHYTDVNLAWFWARIYKRTKNLMYYRGGFQAFVDGVAAQLSKRNITVQTGTPVRAVRPRTEGGYTIELDGQSLTANRVLSTVSPEAMQRLAPDLPPSYLGQLRQLQSMGAVVLTVALDRQLMKDVYWVNVPRSSGMPFLALVEHTNMIDPANYGGDHLLYIGNYLDPDHRYFQMDAEELLAEFAPHLINFNAAFQSSWVTGAWVHKARYAQPVPVVGYADLIPAIRTPLPGLYFASMSQVYPWDRGTNYAIEMGRNVAQLIIQDAFPKD